MTTGTTAWSQRGLVSPPVLQRTELRTQGWWGDHCLLDWWLLAVRSRPEACAVVDRSGVSYTYSQADEVSSKLATWLTHRGVGPGDVVAVQLPNWSEFLPALIATMKVGATINPLSPNLRRSELSYALELCDARVVVMATFFRHTDFCELARELAGERITRETTLFVSRGRRPRHGELEFEDVVSQSAPLPESQWVHSPADDVGAILFTSGSETRPKGVMLTHNNLIASEVSFTYALRIGLEDSMLMPAPLGHATGFLHGVIAPIIARATAVLCDSTCGDDMATMVKELGVTCGMSVPAVVDALLCTCEGTPRSLDTVRFLCCGGSPVPRRLLERAHDLGVRLYSVYGSTESAPHTMTTFHDSDERVLASDGRACPGTQIRIVDPVTRETLPPGMQGEEESRGPAVFSGYLGHPELTAQVLDEDGWYHSGDLAVMDEDGYIRITGRLKDLIIRGGENISPAEVECALMDHPCIQSAAVVGVTDPVMGQRALAFLVMRPDCGHLDVRDLRRWFDHQGIAKFKIPEYVIHLEEMPLTSSGKVDKVTLRRMAREEAMTASSSTADDRHGEANPR